MEQPSGIVKFTNLILRLLTHSFVISAVSLFLGVIGPGSSFMGNVFGVIGFFGLIITVKLFILHVIVFLISKLIGSK